MDAMTLIPAGTTIRYTVGYTIRTDAELETMAETIARKKGTLHKIEIGRTIAGGRVLFVRGDLSLRREENGWRSLLFVLDCDSELDGRRQSEASFGRRGDVSRAHAGIAKSDRVLALAKLVADVGNGIEAAYLAAPLRSFELQLEGRYGPPKTVVVETHRSAPLGAEFGRLLARQGWRVAKPAPPYQDAAGRWFRPTAYVGGERMKACLVEPAARMSVLATAIVEPVKIEVPA